VEDYFWHFYGVSLIGRFTTKLHETGKRYEVSETGTIRNRPSKNGNVGGNARGNAVYKKIKKK
jgi:hypothetical protein